MSCLLWLSLVVGVCKWVLLHVVSEACHWQTVEVVKRWQMGQVGRGWGSCLFCVYHLVVEGGVLVMYGVLSFSWRYKVQARQ
ncbi:hypothetical protein D3C77_659960 [compost metagenome]